MLQLHRAHLPTGAFSSGTLEPQQLHGTVCYVDGPCSREPSSSSHLLPNAPPLSHHLSHLPPLLKHTCVSKRRRRGVEKEREDLFTPSEGPGAELKLDVSATCPQVTQPALTAPLSQGLPLYTLSFFLSITLSLYVTLYFSLCCSP